MIKYVTDIEYDLLFLLAKRKNPDIKQSWFKFDGGFKKFKCLICEYEFSYTPEAYSEHAHHHLNKSNLIGFI